MAERPRLLKIDDDMRRWCATLEAEISSWPQVSTRPMFGMVGFYRAGRIFAAIPRTRAASTERSLLIKLPARRDRRPKPARELGAGWVTFELGDESDLATALQWLERAYERLRSDE